MNDNNKYNIITLCGSIKFKDEFLKLQEKLTLDGNIVLTPNFFNNVKKEEINLETKKMLDEMHKQKIDMSDEIYVINFGGYIGESTKSEIEYAKTKDKKISYIEDIKEIAIMEEKKEDTKCDHGFNNTLADAIEKIKSEKWKSIFIERLNDKTLSQIGNEMNLSRERINKIVDKILSEINIINEDKYRDVFEKYFIDQELFCEVFSEDINTYRYLNLKYNRGYSSIEDLYYSNQLDENQNEILKKYIDNKHKKVSNDNWYIVFNSFLSQNKLTAKKVSELTGLSKPTIDSYKQGKRKPTDENMQIIKDKLGFNISKILYNK